jgi:hypothetical protein
MASLNTAAKSIPVYTHEGAKALLHVNAYQMLRRSVCSCMLWEREFYEDGETVASRIASLIKEVDPFLVAELACEAREKFKLRHVPLLLARELARIRFKLTASVLFRVIQRPDELTEFLAIYWKDGKCPLSAQVKKGLAAAFTKFNSYSLAKYNRDDTIKLRDVLFLSHAKPLNEDQAEVWKKLVAGTLESPDTWEVLLSAGANKKETWERLLTQGKLGGLALLRNIRNMKMADVKTNLIIEAIADINAERILPYRFIAASRFAPDLEPYLETAMLKCMTRMSILKGHTVVLVDVSGSMDDRLSAKSDLTRLDAACGVTMILRELCERVTVLTFSSSIVQVPSRRGFALRDVIYGSQIHSSTYLGKAVSAVYSEIKDVDRLIVFTDEQSHDRVPDPSGPAYMINVASARNGVGYGKWTHVDGFSEAVIDWVKEYETIGTAER